MARTLSSLLALLLLAAAPAVAKSKTAAAVAAANAAKADFHARNAPSRPTPEGVGVANRSLKVLVAAVLEDGTLALHDLSGQPLGTLDPLTIPELLAQDKARFGGRRHLEASDFEAGHRLKLVFRGNTTEILRAKVLKDRNR